MPFLQLTLSSLSFIQYTLPQHTTDSKNKLYFVNLGGYDKNQFTELHQNIFVVAENDQQAKLKAVATIQNWESPHRDYLFEAESIVNLNTVLSNQDIHIHLHPSQAAIPFEFTCLYTPIGAF